MTTSCFTQAENYCYLYSASAIKDQGYYFGQHRTSECDIIDL